MSRVSSWTGTMQHYLQPRQAIGILALDLSWTEMLAMSTATICQPPARMVQVMPRTPLHFSIQPSMTRTTHEKKKHKMKAQR